MVAKSRKNDRYLVKIEQHWEGERSPLEVFMTFTV
jgi:hypothetical protein